MLELMEGEGKILEFITVDVFVSIMVGIFLWILFDN